MRLGNLAMAMSSVLLGCEGAVSTMPGSLTPPAPVSVTAGTLPSGSVGTAYAASLEATGGCLPYRWSVTGGALPSGVGAVPSSDTASYFIAGTPTSAADFAFTVQVTDCGGHVASQSESIQIQAPLTPVVISTQSLPNGAVGTAYSSAIQASGGCMPYEWSLSAGTLAPGLHASPSSDTQSYLVSGTPTSATTASFTVQVMDCSGHVDTQSYSVQIQAATAPVSISTTSLPNGTVGASYAAAVDAVGGCTPYVWSLSTGTLPPGLSGATSADSKSYAISGAPTAAATSDAFTVRVTDCAGGTSSHGYAVQIQTPDVPAITTSSLPTGFVDVGYAKTFAASGGAPPYTWSIASGTLPAGLTLAANGALSGTPSTSGSSTFTVKVTDSAAASSTASFSVTVAHDVLLTWTANGTAGVTYDVYRSTVTGGSYGLIASSVSTPSYVDTSVNSGATYFYVLTAVDGSGASGYSVQVTAAVP